MTTAQPISREERRRRTEGRVLEAARDLFADLGFEKTTIRGVAARAGVDPALVMQYFGNKEGLFAASARWSPEQESLLTADRAAAAEAALDDFFARFGGDSRAASVALMRACLTHPTASTVMRDEVMCDRAQHVASLIPGDLGDEAELRAGLFGACMMGLGMARYLLELPAVASASEEDVRRLMVPVLEQLLGQ